MSKKIGTESYKGVRDFFPQEQFIQDYIFFVWESTLESFGYEKYHASILEPTELYIAKSGEEIVNDQTYNFKDRGDRDVTLRPEMTPTVARMIAGKRRELSFPVRWFSIPNLFRYERPQRGRLREHWQLNADIFGIENIEAEAEMIQIAYKILRNFGLNDSQFEIRINDISHLAQTLKDAGLSEIQIHQYKKLLDKKDKIDNFDEQVRNLFGRPFYPDIKESESVEALLDKVRNRGISNISFSPNLVRGFDYYNGIVFEVFSTDPENNRSIFGGGRYDNLTSIFGEESVPAVGFGMGDVTTRDVLETYGLLPNYEFPAILSICPLNDAFYNYSSELAQDLRDSGISVIVDYSGKKIGDQITKAIKKGVQFIICIGEEEINRKKFTIKIVNKNKEKTVSLNKITKFVEKNISR
ncbi:MAG: histidine--tRNA ligase [Candidatus Paceibacterota bacterium]